MAQKADASSRGTAPSLRINDTNNNVVIDDENVTEVLVDSETASLLSSPRSVEEENEWKMQTTTSRQQQQQQNRLNPTSTLNPSPPNRRKMKSVSFTAAVLRRGGDYNDEGINPYSGSSYDFKTHRWGDEKGARENRLLPKDWKLRQDSEEFARAEQLGGGGGPLDDSFFSKENIWLWMMGKHGFRDWLSALWAEFLGTYLLIFVGCGSISVGEPKEVVGAVFGLCLIFLIESFLPFSDAHFNPVVSMVMFLNRKIPFMLCLSYAFIQCLASMLAAFTIKLLIPGADQYHYGITNVNGDIYSAHIIWKPLLLEILMTFILLYVIMTTGLHEKSVRRKALSTFSVASVVCALTILGGGLSGCSMNPARSLGPAIVDNSWDHHWIYWVGPPVGGFLAWVVYNLTHGIC
jgi:MIP family channel proteins